VIGAGPAGLASVKELKERGFDVIAFDLQPTIGGVYANHYEDLQLTTGCLNTSFGSWSIGGDQRPEMWSRVKYLEYLHGFAGRFDLFRHIHLSTRVERLRRDVQTGRWHLRAVPCDRSTQLHHGRAQPEVVTRKLPSRGPVSAEGQDFEFDSIAVCAGVNMTPRLPEWPGAERFQGRILHSRNFWNAEDVAGKRVLIVGLGESGSDIALIAARAAAATAISTRRGPGYVIPRYYRGLPSDIDTSRCHHAIPRWLLATPALRLKSRIEAHFLGPEDDPSVLKAAAAINRERGSSPFHRFGTKNTSFVEAIVHHGALYKPDVARIHADRAVFADGTEFLCDVILCATGYRPTFPFLEEHEPALAAAGEAPRGMYKHMFVPGSGPGLAFIGLVRPGLGTIPPCAEMQARYYALILDGARALPPAEAMQQDIERHTRLDREQYPEDADRLSALTDYLRFMEGMAEVIGCRPPLRELFLEDHALWAKVMFGPLMAAQYRLRGPGADPAGARAAILGAPTMPWPVLAYEALLLFGCKALHTLGLGERFAPVDAGE
jgi:dimethylaniline monooxygenase (N-oxide forming)